MYKRGKIYYERFSMPDGKTKRICLGTSDEDVAEKIKAKIQTDILMDRHFGQKNCKAKTTVRNLIHKYLDVREKSITSATLRQEQMWARQIIKEFGDLLLDGVTALHIDEYVAKRRMDGLKDSTIGHTCRAFKRAFVMAKTRWKLTDNNPFDMVKLPTDHTKRVRFVRDDEMEIIYKALSQSKYLWLRDYVVVACETGLRRRNMCEMLWRHVDFQNGQITFDVTETKNGKPLMIPMSDNVLDILTRRYNKNKRGVVFLNNHGRAIHKEYLTSFFTKLMRSIGIDNLRIHDLRHDFCSKLVQKGVPLNVVMELAGHSDISQTLRYAHLQPKQKSEAIKVFNRKAPAQIRTTG